MRRRDNRQITTISRAQRPGAPLSLLTLLMRSCYFQSASAVDRSVGTTSKMCSDCVHRTKLNLLINNVFQYTKREAEDAHNYDLKTVWEKTAAITAMKVSRVKKAIRETNAVKRKYRSLYKKKAVNIINDLNNYKKGILKRMVHTYHVTENELPTIHKLLVKIQKQIFFKGNSDNLRRLLNELGFRWVITDSDKQQYCLMEKRSLRLKRTEYLENISLFRAEKRTVVFTAELFIASDSSMLSSNSPHNTKASQIYMLLAGSVEGYVDNSLVSIDTDAGGDFDEDTRLDFYQRWIKEHVIPNLPENSLVVIHNDMFYETMPDTPRPCATKLELEHWLLKNNVPFSPAMSKPQLSKLCKDQLNHAIVQQMFKDANVPVLLLPPHHPDLNPMDEVWALVTNHVAMQNVSFERNVVIEMFRCKLEELQNSCELFEIFENTQQIEQEYLKSDWYIDELTDRIVLHDLESADSETDTEGFSFIFSDSEDEDEGPEVAAAAAVAAVGPRAGPSHM
ncbi:uncharacterized protein [Battus philenor]|uniref:uncharacterized protein n=1 Tax=Battus philenor TaxID=42288 RepID=UPI0035CF6AB3